MSDETIIRAQRERIDELEEENRQLRERLKVETWRSPRCFRLTKTERALLGVLMEVQEISSDRMRFRLYGHEYRSDQLLHVHVTHIRRKIEPFGVTVSRVHGRGLYLTGQDKGRIRAMLDREQAGGTSAAQVR